ncbi:MAG: nickel-dependent hydrogenase large subunit [Planctomycetes bacterium]|nr:nickel-dependent hydrogenase large subunit [Planctomycetota bacterium]
MATRLTIDPITRIEGHLRVDVEVDSGAVSKAWASCTMWRGIERILIGRDPREAWFFTQRFCGVCTTVHAMASVRAVEDALKLEIPLNAHLIRNLILIAHALHDHIVHFYHLSALDWVDVTQVPLADPKKAAAAVQGLSNWTGNSAEVMAQTQERVKGLLATGQLGIFAHGYWGHPAMKLSPEVNLVAVAHYLQALEFQRKSNQIVAILGGKTPHIQNMAVGGVMNAVDLDSQAALNLDRLFMIRGLFEEVTRFVREVYFPDVCLIAGLYNDWFDYGAGHKHYLAVPDLPTDTLGKRFDLPGGVLFDARLADVKPMDVAGDAQFRANVVEDVTHAWYRGRGAQAPWAGETVPEYTDFHDDGKYTWVKAPRYDGKPMEVGPLADVLVGYASKHARTVKWLDSALGLVSTFAGKPIGVDKLPSTMGRHLARAVRTAILAELALEHHQKLVDNVLSGDLATFVPPVFPSGEVQGVGVHEAPRGTLSHWVVIENGKLTNYQAVVPTTWNASPRDVDGVGGPYEAALLGNPIAVPEQPLEVLRTVHSFDPCMACACHAYDPRGNRLATIRVR